MWLIFAPSSDKEQQPGTGGYNIEMPDADKAVSYTHLLQHLVDVPGDDAVVVPFLGEVRIVVVHAFVR